jgi:hypothetical protein
VLRRDPALEKYNRTSTPSMAADGPESMPFSFSSQMEIVYNGVKEMRGTDGHRRIERYPLEVLPMDTSNSLHFLHVRNLRTFRARLYFCENRCESKSWPPMLCMWH